MLDEKRIEEASKNVPIYLQDGLLTKVKESNKKIQQTYERNFKESLEVATKLFN